MAVSLPNGAIVEIGTALASPAIITALSNASSAVATATNTYADGDYVVVTSGWSALTDRVVRVDAPSGTSFTMEGIDTSDTNRYSAGSGVGASAKVNTWVQLQQILSSSSNGGEQQFLDYQFLESDAAKRIPTFKSPSGLTFTVADDPTLAGYIAAKAANDDRKPRAVRVSLPNGAKLLYYSYISLAPSPTLTVNEVMAVEITLSNLGEPVRYAS